MSAIGNCPDLDALAALAREATAGEWETPAEKPWRVYSGDVLIAVANGMTHPSDEVNADANAALSALAEPTEAMVDAGEAANISVRDAWDAMIGAAGD